VAGGTVGNRKQDEKIGQRKEKIELLIDLGKTRNSTFSKYKNN
jgi:hypothetical protein